MKWYKRDPDAALAGMIGLTPEERGIYNTVLDLLYSRDGNLPTDDTFFARANQCRPQVWRRVRDSLIAKGKLHFKTDGKLTANRVETELKTAGKLIANMSKLGTLSAEKRKENKEQPPTEPLVTTTTTTTTTPREEEKRTVFRLVAKATPTDTAFDGFWKLYPSRGTATNPKAPARKLFEAAIKAGIPPETIIVALEAGAGIDQGKIGTEFIPQAVKWLRDKRYLDYEPDKAGELMTFTAPPGAPSDDELRQRYAARNNKSGGPEILPGINGGGEEAIAGEGGEGPVGPADKAGPGGVRCVGGIFSKASGLDAGRFQNGDGGRPEVVYGPYALATMV